MRRLAAGILLAGVLGAMLIATATPAGAANAKGCNGSGVSLDDGIRIDSASAPGAGATSDNPFDVTTDGKIKYSYSVNQGALSGGKWTVVIPSGFEFIPDIKFSGNIDPGSSQSGDGVEPMKKHLQVKGISLITGMVVEMQIKARAGGVKCDVSGFIKIHASVFTTAAFYLAFILLVLAVLLFFLGMGASI